MEASNMKMTVDSHTHPYQERRCYEEMELYAETALAKGLTGIAFTEHAPMSFPLDSHFLTEAELERYIRSTKLPFFIKGALSAYDALRCRDLGAAGLILSHHNGLMRYAVPPVMVLPEIRRAIGRDLILIADGGIESGFDAFKALARGADAVTMGKALMAPLKEKGAEGVRETLIKAAGQLKAMMIRTGIKDLKHMDPSVIYEPAGYRHG